MRAPGEDRDVLGTGRVLRFEATDRQAMCEISGAWELKNTLSEYRKTKTVDLLNAWALWARHDDPKIGYPRKSCGVQSGPQVVTVDSSDEQQDEAEAVRCAIVDQCIDDLEVPAHRAAINRCYVSATYRMRDYGLMLYEAHTELQKAFVAKGIMA